MTHIEDDHLEFLGVATLVLALVVPVLHGLVLAALWAAPLPARTQHVLRIVASALHGTAALDVFLVTVIAIWAALPGVADYVDDAACGDAGAYAQTFARRAFDQDPVTCVSLGTSVHRGCILVACACASHVVLAALSAKATVRGVAERNVARTRVLTRLLDALRRHPTPTSLPADVAAAVFAEDTAKAPGPRHRLSSVTLGGRLFQRGSTTASLDARDPAVELQVVPATTGGLV